MIFGLDDNVGGAVLFLTVERTVVPISRIVEWWK